MGKNLKGRECGTEFYQRKDGLYSARYNAKDGSRPEKYFETLPEARNWLADAIYEDKHACIPKAEDMTVDQWYRFRMDNLICDLAPNTRRNYSERCLINAQPVIGKMKIMDIKPMHCKAILNRMEPVYAGSTIRQTYIAIGTMFRAAVIFINFVTRLESNGFVCTRSGTPTQRARLRVGCSRKYFRNCLVMRASRRRGTGMSMSQTIRSQTPCRRMNGVWPFDLA